MSKLNLIAPRPTKMQARHCYLVVFAGPNGSGKSTLIAQIAAGFSVVPVAVPDHILNPDEFARAIDPMNPDRIVVEAGRAGLEQRARLLAGRADFAIETTLSGNVLRLRDGRASVRSANIPQWAHRALKAELEPSRIQ